MHRRASRDYPAVEPETPLEQPAPFTVESSDVDGLRVLRVQGELDLGTAPALETALEDSLGIDSKTIVVNLTECEFIDSTGIALIVRAWQKREADGSGTVAVCCATDQVERVLRISGVDSTIPLFADLDSALAALAGGNPA